MALLAIPARAQEEVGRGEQRRPPRSRSLRRRSASASRRSEGPLPRLAVRGAAAQLPVPAPTSSPPPARGVSRARSRRASRWSLTATLVAEGGLGGGVAAKVEVRFSDLSEPATPPARTTASSCARAGCGWANIVAAGAAEDDALRAGRARPASPSSSRGGSRARLWAPRSAASSGKLKGGSFGQHVYWREHDRQQQPGVLPRRERAGRRQRHAQARAWPTSIHPGPASPCSTTPSRGTSTSRTASSWAAAWAPARRRRLGLRRPRLGTSSARWRTPRASAARSTGTSTCRGVAFPLPFSGNDKHEAAATWRRASPPASLRAVRGPGCAEPSRDGFEVEAAYVISLNGLFAYKDAVRRQLGSSRSCALEDEHQLGQPREFPASPCGWDWGGGTRPPLRHRDRSST